MNGEIENFVNNPLMAEVTGQKNGGMAGMAGMGSSFDDFLSDSVVPQYDDWTLDNYGMGGDDLYSSTGYDSTGFDFSDELASLLDSVPDILSAVSLYQQGATLNDINLQRAEMGYMPITSAQMNAVNTYAQQYPQQYAQYYAQSGYSGMNMQQLMPIFLIGALALCAVFILKGKK